MGRLIAIVGASGVGKDTVMAHLRDTVPALHWATRVITRPADPNGENHVVMSDQEFAACKEQGDFALDWQAHGLHYAIPHNSLNTLKEGADVLVNLSRKTLLAAHELGFELVIINLTATRAVLAERLAKRGRETSQQIEDRLNRSVPSFPHALNVTDIDNSNRITDTVASIIDHLNLESKDMSCTAKSF